MAITKIHAIKSTLGKALAYIENPDKTDGQMLVSGYNCEPQTASIDFEMTAVLAHKARNLKRQRSTNLAYHLIQSFSPEDAVTPEQAHELGKKLAFEYTGGKYEYVVATHIDKGHIHNHIMINAVSFYDYKKLRTVPYRTARQIRDISDRLCMEAHLSVIDDPQKIGQLYPENAGKKKSVSNRTEIRKRLNFCLERATDYSQFLSMAKELEITPTIRGKHMSYLLEGAGRAVRDNSLSDTDTFTYAGICARLSDNAQEQKYLRKTITGILSTATGMADFADKLKTAGTAAAFAGGTGTAEDPYQIANGAELAYLASSVNNGETYEAKNFVLTANIDLNGLPWTPIANSFSDALFGGSDYRVFAGNFDGKGYTISNVSIGSETTPLESDVLGLFGATEGKISNLNLDTVSIHGVAKIASGYVIGIAGGLVGSSAGSIENCHVTGLAMDMSAPSDVYAAAYWVGGLVGALDGAQLINECSVSGSITEKAGKGSIGGLIGELGKAAKITYSRSDVTVNVKADSRGGANVGGFIGKGNGKTDAETIIRNCYATGNVTGGAYTGGFAGGLWGLNIKNCYASGNVSQAAAAMASFVGTDASDPNYYGSITNCFATGSVTGSSPFRYAFAMQDATKRSEITNCYFAEENSSIKNQNESATEKPQDKMKTEAFAAELNNGANSNGWSFVNGQVLGGAEPADYSAVEAAMAAIPSDLTVYTDESDLFWFFAG